MNWLDLWDEQFKQLVLKDGTAERYERLVRMRASIAHAHRRSPGGCDLDLPDLSAFDAKPPRLSLVEIVFLSEALCPWVCRNPDFGQRRLETKSPEEFVL